ncbi:hypothetical protein M422DRAFT_259327 [Sphaerobolus stellatus SS14]|uniref:Cytochrome P450 n=1 Tax=Sphaerobolus stellatus (strain SS14) TaxID=990650 RepID=A0A0C9VKB0_SPHS4|nr:hypothetical protein M422DRAFT_259327 [Sphaerobolus stellatus SS14]
MDTVAELNRISASRIHNAYWNITEAVDSDGKMFKAMKNQLLGIINDIIEKKRSKKLNQTNDDPEDFLSTLLETPNLSDDLIRDTLIMLLFASRDTTQNALVWSLSELNQKPDWIGKMREEWSIQGQEGSLARYSDLQRFPIHLAVLYETLRLWPVIPKNARIATIDTVLPAIPEAKLPAVKVDKGDYVFWSDYSMMRNTKVTFHPKYGIWGETAESFDPAHHLSPTGDFMRSPQPKFHGFGAGPRACPGAQLASYQFIAIWASLLSSFNIMPVEQKERYPTDGLTMMMEGTFMVKIAFIK